MEGKEGTACESSVTARLAPPPPEPHPCTSTACTSSTSLIKYNLTRQRDSGQQREADRLCLSVSLLLNGGAWRDGVGTRSHLRSKEHRALSAQN